MSVVELFRLTCLGSPVAQPRQQQRVVRTKAGDAFATNYTPRTAPVQQFKADLKRAAIDAGLPAVLFDGPLIFQARFYLPRPAKLLRKRDFVGPVPHTAKPDLDNLLKAAKDALTGVLWRDDAQIYAYHGASKFYHEKDGRPRAELVLYRPATATDHLPSAFAVGGG